ncbi:hypothetical protein AnigIFM56816_000498 [Aspergillus niger]|nr:hypothetical protein AnigIFM56816_000498 [Aspergillus niger]
MGLHEAIFNRMPREHWLAGTQAKVCGTWKIHQALGKLKSEFALDFLLLTDASDWASYRRSGISTSTAKSVNSSVKASVPFPRTKSFKSSTLALSSEIDQQQKVPRDRLAQYHILTGIEDTKLQDHRKQDFTGFWRNLDNTRFSVLINALQRQESQSKGGVNTLRQSSKLCWRRATRSSYGKR